MGFVYLQQPSNDKHAAALKIFENLYAADRKAYAASLGYAYGKLGKKAEAINLLDQLERMENTEEYLPAHEKALLYIGLGDREKSLLWLDKAYQEHFNGLAALNVDPLYDDLRSDGEFQDLLVKMNFNNKF